MTIEAMRALLNMPEGEYTDQQVVAAYAVYLAGEDAAEADLSVPLVTLETAKAHLRVLDDDHDDDIALKALSASHIVIDYIQRYDHGWDAETVPPLVRASVLLVLGALFEDREGGEPLSRGVQALLERYRTAPLV